MIALCLIFKEQWYWFPQQLYYFTCPPVEHESSSFSMLSHLILLPNSGSAAHYSKASTPETTVDWKWKLALFKRPATEEKADSCPKTSSKDSAWSWKFLKGESFGEEVRIYYLSLWADFFWLVGGEVTGWCSRNLVLNLKLTPSTWLGGLSSCCCCCCC